MGGAIEQRQQVALLLRQPEQGGLLGLAPGAPALRVAGITYDQHDRAVELSSVLYQADRFRFTLESFRHGDRVMHLIGQGRPRQ